MFNSFCVAKRCCDGCQRVIWGLGERDRGMRKTSILVATVAAALLGDRARRCPGGTPGRRSCAERCGTRLRSGRGGFLRPTVGKLFPPLSRAPCSSMLIRLHLLWIRGGV